jgi:hypothetical protein
MIPDDEKFKYAEPRAPRKETPGLLSDLESLGFRPFTDEW